VKRTTARGVAASVLVVLTSTTAMSAAHAAPSKVTFCGTPLDVQVADVGATGESAGDMRILRYTLLDKAGKAIGTATQVSTLTSTQPTQDAVGRVTFTLPKGKLIVESNPSFSSGYLSPKAVPINQKEYGVVLGGSGDYKGARGVMTLKITDPAKPLGCWTADLT